MTSMRSHQKYFSLVDDKNNLLPYFITISNMRVENPKVIVKGNEKVLTARLTDAQFLYNADKKIPLAKRIDGLKKVVFQEKLGSMYDKAQRLVKLSEFIANSIDKKIKNNVKRAAMLAKADLITEMVGEFPDLQGIIGKYYAQISGEQDAVARAIGEHYLPRHAGDVLPQATEGAIISLADKLDNLVGYFALGFKPTATEDPYALRRQVLGILQIIWNKEFNVSLDKILNKALNNYGRIAKNKKKTEKELMEFMAVRLENILESKKISKPMIEAVLTLGYDNLTLVKKRLSALNSAQRKPAQGGSAPGGKEFEQFKAAFKRVRNILGEKITKKSVKENLLKEQAEKDLQKAYSSVEKDFAKQIKNSNYSKAMEILMGLAPAINKFFDDVLVMAKEKKVRENRVALLGNIYLMAQEIAEFGKII